MKTIAYLRFSPALLIMVFLISVSCDSTVGTQEIANIQQSQVGISNIESGESVILYAGQTMEAGEVSVTDDGTTLTVTYSTNDDWVLTETHLSIGTSVGDIPATKKGNPKVGRFEHKMTHDPAVISYSYNIPLADVGATSGDELVIAAHAVVQSAEVNAESAPYYASSILDANQGLKKDGSAVDAARSNPDNALEYETGRDVSNFFSLGFGGDISLGFSCPIVNGPGDDLRVIEDTWGGGYPLEKANVYVSQDGVNWELLGEADNTDLDIIHTQSFFDLSSIGWDSAMYVKVVDISDPAVHNNQADAYDLNAVEALHDCADITLLEGDETAWGAGDRFVDRGNWATYFNYSVE